MYVVLGVFAAVLVVVGLFFIRHIPDPRSGELPAVSGIVVEKETGEPVPGALVFIAWRREIGKIEGRATRGYPYIDETITGPDGTYAFEAQTTAPLEFGESYQLRIYAFSPRDDGAAFGTNVYSPPWTDFDDWRTDGAPPVKTNIQYSLQVSMNALRFEFERIVQSGCFFMELPQTIEWLDRAYQPSGNDDPRLLSEVIGSLDDCMK